ncbi:O-fucosyltransferase 20-like [Curcuma longa]|uniref:O-fucosyltransferase 20-like n=1 Tax=Curcuma longa TaxID=136217 RepID=UPI003D9E1246
MSRDPYFARLPKLLLLSISFLLALLRTIRIGFELDRLLLPSSPVPCSNSSSPRSLTAATGGGGGEAARLVEPSEFWRQPDRMGYRPCLRFSEQYRAESEEARRSPRRKYLLVVVSGELNQQRNQIIDAVVISRILGAALVVPILQVNVIWGDESEFNDIFDLEHFKKVLSETLEVSVSQM